MRVSRLALLAAVTLIGGGTTFGSATALASCEPQVGTLVSVTGTVEVQRASGNQWSLAPLNEIFCEGDTIRVGERSRAAVSLINEAVLRIDQASTIRLLDITGEAGERSWLDLLNGALQSFSRKPRLISVNTPYLNGSIEGTEFVMRVEDGTTQVTVMEGVVTAANDQGSVALSPGESASASAGIAPQRRTVVRPRDQVQWALYYPPILSADAIAAKSPMLAEASDCAARGDTACAFAELDRVPTSARDAQFFLLRSSLLLSVGQVEDARTDIDEALRQDPGAGLAYALRSVIAVAQDDREQALADGRRGVELSPDSASAKIALSYALQADLQLQQARDTLQQAVDQHPDDALALARLAELQLMLGQRRDSRLTAERAAELEPTLSRTQSVLGFAALAEIRIDQARRAFERAVALDSADPMPRLGLGLSTIRKGALAEGRAELETAVALDSNQSLLRSYLGKAYFEEKRAPLDAEQFAIAEQLDPLDPTAFLYDAIRLQTENRPVEALRQLEKSIELNDNRAVYRSRLELDQDRAARGASLARIFNDLGFRQQGINEASKSVSIDPANAGAHRFLSDVYLTAPRHESARISELQQAQMLQQVNINPIQPSLAEANLNIVTQGGPARAGFNEFTPLFEQNGAQANVSVLAGSNDTVSGEMVVSGLYDQVSVSAGAFGYDTEGYRPNNHLEHEIYNFFGQVAVTPTLNLQAEYQQRNTKYGDLEMNFDPKVFSPNQHNELDTEAFRVGATLRPTANSTFLVLYNHRDTTWARADEFVIAEIPPGPVLLTEDVTTDETADQIEGTFIFQGNAFNIVAGAAYTEIDAQEGLDVIVLEPTGDQAEPIFEIPLVQDSFDLGNEDTRGYVYANIAVPSNLTWTVGISYQEAEGDDISVSETNPKFGVSWDVTDGLRLRAAYFEAMKPLIANNRTLEPTQVAGFNQLFDDVDFTRSTRYGFAADWQPLQTVALGAAWTRRELESPVFATTDGLIFEDRNEWTHRAYATWTPTSEWALSLEAVYDKFTNDEDSVLAAILPERVRTVSIPVKATYFHPKGFFASLGTTYVDQQVRRNSASELPQGDSEFAVVDLSIGYRLPKRRGILSLSALNLFDEEFEYQDDSYRKFGDEPIVTPYTPDRLVMAKVVLSF
jgi:tetratricopeptide (TPR) repeat protein